MRENQAEALKLIDEIKARWVSPHLSEHRMGSFMTKEGIMWFLGKVSETIPAVGAGIAAGRAAVEARELAERLDRLAELIRRDQ